MSAQGIKGKNNYQIDENNDDIKRGRNCPYLDTINRSVLDFDFEKLCSVSLSHVNVYACLVCGKYFQGRGLKSHAYTHSVQEMHHVFLNLETKKFFCLPDNYEIIDQTLEDITYVLNPTFTKKYITEIDISTKLARAYDGSTYIPGIIGLNNIKANDYCNVVLQALSQVTPLRNFFLREENYANIKRPPGDIMFIVVQRFGELIRKLWNPRSFKAHVSPHEMLQSVVLCSKKCFQITKQGDCVDFLSWLLNTLNQCLSGGKKKKKTIITESFQGEMNVYTRKVLPLNISAEEQQKLIETEEYKTTMMTTPFLYLTCDLPPCPLYPDEMRENIIPQVPFFNVISKFNAINEKEYKSYKEEHLKRFEITKLPPYLILYFKRFNKTMFILEKNPTIINFPVKGIDFGEILLPEIKANHPHTTYNLIANIVHDGEPGPGKGTFRVHILNKGSGKWHELQDLHCVEILPQMITLSESYVQIYELKIDDSKSNGNSIDSQML